MIKATIQNSPYCTEIQFPCSVTELSKKLDELGMNPEHLAPITTVLEVEPCGFPACRGPVKRMAEYDLLSYNILFFI